MKKIKWHSQHMEMDTFSGKLIKKQEDKNFDDGHDDEDEDIEEITEIINSMPIITQTPFGMYKLDDTLHPFKNFKFWLGHTNFKITEEIFNTLNLSIDGIECLKVVSPYRFLIAIGELFEFTDVRIEIEEKLCTASIEERIEEIQNKEIEEQVIELINGLSMTESQWAVYVLPNGNINYSVESEDNDYESNLEIYKKSKQVAGGILIESK